MDKGLFMTTHSAETYLKHPTYSSALKHFQEGKWEASLKELDWVIKQFPSERGLYSLKQDIQIRSSLDQVEKVDDFTYRRRRLISLFIRVFGFTTIVLISIAILGYFSSDIQERLQIAQSAIEQEVLLIEHSAKFRDAQALLSADRPEEAYVLLQEIVAAGGDFPSLQNMLIEAQDTSNIKAKYEEAKQLIEIQDWVGARVMLEEISGYASNYRDVPLLLASLDSNAYLSDIFNQSSIHFEAEEWEAAAEGFESLRALDPNFDSNVIEPRLFESYVNAARFVLIDQEDSLEALKIAETYFRKALALRPQNPDIKSERELARYYIDAQANFLTGRWTDVIAALEVVHSRDPGYAMGTALQTLYEAYVARGDSRLLAGDYDQALSDFQRAVILAEQDAEAYLRLYEAQLKAAEAQGSQDNYEAAVLLYRSAVEISRLRELAKAEDLQQLALLDEAEYYATQGNFSVSYERYRSALGILPGNFCMSFEPYQDALHFNVSRNTMKKHVIESGEYLTLIANRYRSTVCAIVLANDISNPNTIYTGQELLVPVLD
jgi:tetratricopeptide (TPR) repeat protein